MKVKELIELLQEMDPEAEVLLAEQPGWPFEYSVRGVAVREDVMAEDADHDPAYPPGTSPTDVFLVEGAQIRYASKSIWGVARSS